MGQEVGEIARGLAWGSLWLGFSNGRVGDGANSWEREKHKRSLTLAGWKTRSRRGRQDKNSRGHQKYIGHKNIARGISLRRYSDLRRLEDLRTGSRKTIWQRQDGFAVSL